MKLNPNPAPLKYMIISSGHKGLLKDSYEDLFHQDLDT